MSKKIKFYEEPSFLSLRPERRLQWETREGDLVTLIVPKFRNQFTVKWFVPLLAKPNFKVKLDPLGSYVWNRCDGKTSVETIVQNMHEEFSDSVESLRERVGSFLAKLNKEGFLSWTPEVETHS